MEREGDAIEALIGDGSDPRLTGEYVRYLPARDDDGFVVIAGVVHDHPASMYRTGTLVDLLQPDIVAVELPRVAIPLFESFQADEHGSNTIGGEMSVALRRATGTKVGIDAPSLLYVKRLYEYLRDQDVPLVQLWAIAKDLVLSTAQAYWTILASIIGTFFGVRVRAHTPVEHDSSPTDPPAEQAAAEGNHIATRRTFLHVIEVPQAVEIIDTVREQVMAERLRDLRADGDVFAVVGIEHLDRVADRVSRDE